MMAGSYAQKALAQVARAGVAVVLCLMACTPNAPSGSGQLLGMTAGASVVEVSLLQFAPSQTPYGTVGGYSPNVLIVPVGAIIQFHNRDSFSHTATLVSTTGFTAAGISSAALSRAGTDISAPQWSTGQLNGSAYSQPLLASRPGTYFYGCFYHYGSPMRGVIIVQ
ncbi:MAG: hypothetical protein M3T49_07195 [Candidatus Eremiobacteraeota bacterium]|nr:hypothetical protein [Candidatus Eremiobacteraeota bacterium]